MPNSIKITNQLININCLLFLVQRQLTILQVEILKLQLKQERLQDKNSYQWIKKKIASNQKVLIS